MSLPVLAGVLAATLAAAAPPKIITPGARSQTTQESVRLYAHVSGLESPRLTVNGKPAGECTLGGQKARVAHCFVPLEVGDNQVVLTDNRQSAEVRVIRYLTYKPPPDGVDTMGFGEGTLHRAEVEAECKACHKMDEAAGREKGDNLGGTECASCHQALLGRPQTHGPVGQVACLMCHDASAGPQRYQVKWPIQETCFQCHQDIKGAMDKKAYRHGPAAAGRCTTCHDPHGSPNMFWLKKPVYELCTNCHDEKAAARHVVVGFVYGDSHPLRGRPHPVKPKQEFSCSGCHNPHAAQARFLWQFDAKEREDLCRTCHNK